MTLQAISTVLLVWAVLAFIACLFIRGATHPKYWLEKEGSDAGHEAHPKNWLK